MRFRLVLLIALSSVFIFPSFTQAAWQNNGAPVSTTVGHQQANGIVSDGAGGAIVVWSDTRTGGVNDIYAQRIDAFGKPLWTVDGVVVCNAGGVQLSPVIATDGAGGAIMAWQDNRNPGNDIYVQRINPSGVVQWTPNGVLVCSANLDQFGQSITSDGAGGAIVAWHDYRSAASYDVYAQRVDATGTPLWAANGVALCTLSGEQSWPQPATDGGGGAIVTWFDLRSASTYDVYAQRVSAGGVAQWTVNGIAICALAGDQEATSIAADGTGGAVLTWYDYRGGANSDIYAQRLNAAGVAQWTANGQYVCLATNSQYNPSVVLDGAGGVIIAWEDYRAANHDIYAQRVTLAGALQWQTDGVPLCTATGNQGIPVEVADGTGGAFVGWSDPRSGTNDIYAQHVDVGGNILWSYDGVGVCTAAGAQYGPYMTGDGSGNVIMAWYDYRTTQTYDTYAQRLDGTYGYWGHPEPLVTSVADVHHDQGGKVAVNWKASSRDTPVPETISYYTIWRAVDAVPANLTAGSSSLLRNLKDVREDTKGPVYIAANATAVARGKSGGPLQTPAPPYYWELVGTQSAHGWGGYTFSASTRADSVLASTANEVFMVAAHILYDDYVAFPSNAVTGHSVDNLAPPAPLYLTALRVGADVHLKWNRVHVPDLKNYSIYRATSTGVTPVPGNFLSDDPDTLLVDAGAPTNALYYIVTAKDVHGNQGQASNEANVSGATGVGNLPPITALSVLQNHPNPFSGETQLQLGLPARGDVRVDVYDVAGRRVRTAVMPAQSKGWNTVRLSARDNRGALLPSGVYFYRVHAGSETVTRKMVIAR